MKIIRNKLLPIGKKYAAINLFGVFFVKPWADITPELINHERIHTRQMKEMLFCFFYVAYLAEWLLMIFKFKFNSYEAYRNISFEREAYDNQYDMDYLKKRPLFNQYRKRKVTKK